MKTNTQLKLVAAAVILASSANVMAITSTATVTVKNAFDITEVAPFNIGTVRASADLTGASVKFATLIIDPETGVGTATDDTATIGQLATGTPGEFSITGLAAYQALDITASTSTKLKLVPHPTGGAFFNVDTFTFFVTSIPTPAAYAASGDLKANATGVATFTVGATVKTSIAATPDFTTAQYQDASYTGNYDITISYP